MLQSPYPALPHEEIIGIAVLECRHQPTLAQSLFSRVKTFATLKGKLAVPEIHSDREDPELWVAD
jgi:hypothetical protein